MVFLGRLANRANRRISSPKGGGGALEGGLNCGGVKLLLFFGRRFSLGLPG